MKISVITVAYNSAATIGDTARVAKLRSAISVERARQHHASGIMKLAGAV